MGSAKFTRYRVKNTDADFSGSPRVKSDKWQLIIERDVPNPEFISINDALDADGNDTRTYKQKRRSKTEQRTKMYDGSPVTESKAREAARIWLEQENECLSDSDTAMVTISEYIDAFLIRWERNVEASTMKDYRKAGRRIKKAFGDIALKDLTGKMVTEWVDEMHQQGLSRATQRKSYNFLNLMLRQAVKADDLDANPCDKANPPKTPKADPNPLTDKSRKKLFKLLDDMEPTPLYVAVNIGMFMGLREGETCAIQWKHVDLDENTVMVCQAIGRGEGKHSTYLKTPKNSRSNRMLPLPEPIIEVLKARKDKMQTELDQAGIALSDEEFGELYIIGTIDGKYQNPSTLSRQWHNVAEAFELLGTKGRICTFYDATRHVFATSAVANKIDVNTVAAYMGHDPVLTLRVYADADANAKRAAADIMGSAF